ncbi:unnamed protein product [Echinostoma caproni]|uniref:ZM domain-containing protein n=1 Tax=Echinostoma caproni TaxID=27848 RepID=A0A183ARF1_9TREM|nr:unnamed protein product [Echinostoma caproni]
MEDICESKNLVQSLRTVLPRNCHVKHRTGSWNQADRGTQPVFDRLYTRSGMHQSQQALPQSTRHGYTWYNTHLASRANPVHSQQYHHHHHQQQQQQQQQPHHHTVHELKNISDGENGYDRDRYAEQLRRVQYGGGPTADVSRF